MAKDKIAKAFLAITKDKFTIDTIAEMIATKHLAEGDIVRLNGYYSAGDGANHIRKISKTDDGSGVQLANGLWANVVHDGEVNVSWFGAKGDGVTDDTVAIQRALNSNNKLVKLEAKTYCVSEVIRMRNKILEGINSNIHASETRVTTIKWIGNYIENQAVINCANGNAINTFNVSNQMLHNIRNIKIDGNNIMDCGLYSVYATDNSSYENISIKNTNKVGFYMKYSWYSAVRNLQVSGCKGIGASIGYPLFGESVNSAQVNGVEFDSITTRSISKNNDVSLEYDGSGLIVAGCSLNIQNILSEENDGYGFIEKSNFSNTYGTLYLEANGKLQNNKAVLFELLSSGRSCFISNIVFQGTDAQYIEVNTNGLTVGSTSSVAEISNIFIGSYFVNVLSNDYTSMSRTKTPTSCALLAQYTNQNIRWSGTKSYFFNLAENESEIFVVLVPRNTITATTDFTMALYSHNGTVINSRNIGKIFTVGKPICFRIGYTNSKNGVYGGYISVTNTNTVNNECDIYIYSVFKSLYSGGVNSRTTIETNFTNYSLLQKYVKDDTLIALDTPYHASNMSKLGILDSYHNYLSELHEYEKSQNVQSDSEIMALNVLQPPVIPTEVEEYAKEYNLV